jgi:hypothetical protein
MFISTTPRLTVSQTSPQSPRFALGGLIKPSLIDHSPKLKDLRRLSYRWRAIAAFVLAGTGGRDGATLH